MLSSRNSTSSRREQSYDPPQSPRRRESSSSRTSATTASVPHRTHSTQHSGSHPPSASRQAASFARRDQEQTTLNEVAPQRRSASMDRYRPTSDRRASQDDASRGSNQRSTSRSGQASRPTPSSHTTATASPAIINGNTNGGSTTPATASQSTPQPRRRTTVEAQTGVWSLGKTIGAGSMGKVKLARNQETGEQVPKDFPTRITPKTSC